MNYVAHCLLAENESPEFRFGSMAPDLTKMYGVDLTRIRSDEDRLMLSQTELDVQEGVDFHFRTDTVFDNRPIMGMLKKIFREEIAVQYFPKDFPLIRMLNEIGTDLLYDGYVMDRWPKSANLYHETITLVGSLAMGVATSKPKQFKSKIDERRGTLPDYRDPGVVTKILAWRVSGRPKLQIDTDLYPNIMRAFVDHQKNIWQYGESLFLETQEAVSMRIGNPSS